MPPDAVGWAESRLALGSVYGPGSAHTQQREFGSALRPAHSNRIGEMGINANGRPGSICRPAVDDHLEGKTVAADLISKRGGMAAQIGTRFACTLRIYPLRASSPIWQLGEDWIRCICHPAHDPAALGQSMRWSIR